MPEAHHSQNVTHDIQGTLLSKESPRGAYSKISFPVFALKENGASERKTPSLEFLVEKGAELGEIKSLDVTLKNGKWYRVRDIPEKLGSQILGVIEKAQHQISRGGRDVEWVLNKVHSLVLSEPAVAILDVTATTRQLILEGKFLGFRSIPALAQASIAKMLIDAGCAPFVFYNLKLFEAKLPEVTKMLLGLNSHSVSTALIHSLAESGTHGFAPFKDLSFEVAQELFLSALRFTAVVEADVEIIQEILFRLDKFTPQAKREIHLYLSQSLGADLLAGSDLIQIYSPFFRKEPEWMALLINSLATASEEMPPSVLAHCIGRFPEDEWGMIVDRLIAGGNSHAIKDLPQDVVTKFGESNLAWKFLDAGDVEEFCSSFLPDLSGLGSEIAERMIEIGCARSVLDHQESFEPFPPSILGNLVREGHAVVLLKDAQRHRWDKENLVRAVDAAVAEKGVGYILSNLSGLNEKLLGFLEDKYRLLSYQKDIGIESELVYGEFVKRHQSSRIGGAAFVKELKDLVDTISSFAPCTGAMAKNPFYETILGAIYPNHSRFNHAFHAEAAHFIEDPDVQPQHPEILEMPEIIIRGVAAELGIEPGGEQAAHFEADENLDDERDDDFVVPVMSKEVIQGVTEELGDSVEPDITQDSLTYRCEVVDRSTLDRSHDLNGLRIRPYYRIRLSEGVHMALKDGERLNTFALREVEDPIRAVQEKLSEVKFKKEPMLFKLSEELQEKRARIPSGLNSPEEKIYSLMLESLAGRIAPSELKHLLLMYHFSVVENIQGYLEGTHDRARESKSPDYAYLLYLREFFADALRDTASSIVKASERSERIRELLPEYHQAMLDAIERTKRRTVLNKTQVDKLGVTPKFLERISEILGNEKIPREKKEKAISGMIHAEQQKIATLLATLGSESIVADDIHLGEFKLENYLKGDAQAGATVLEEKHVKMYLADLLCSAFREEIELIDGELRRYKPRDGGRVSSMVIDGVITKNAPSIYARGVAGVCVAGDMGQWNQPHYLQMVLRDPITKRCEGLIMLHRFYDAGRKILVASFQPTSTYLHKVNEEELFRGLVEKLIEFANDNGYHFVTCSTNRGIRTNRTGGAFETAMNRRIREVKKQIKLSHDERFSYSYGYAVKELDVLWEKKRA